MTSGAGGGRSELLDVLELQRIGCELAGSALYATLLQRVADDVGVGGPCWKVLGPYAAAPVGDAVLLRFMAGVHALVLDGRAPALAEHYPSVGGRPGPEAGDRFVAVVEDQVVALEQAMARGVQTNEVGRSAALLCGFLHAGSAGRPLRILELGASAGLNLWFDRYRYRSGAWGFGPHRSPLQFDHPYVGGVPEGPPTLEVVERAACDLDPIDPTTAPGRARLRSYVWADQLDRLARLDAALEATAGEPHLVERDDAVSWLRRRLAEPVYGVVTVVTHSIMFQYLSPADKAALVGVLEDAGRRSTGDAPLAWLRMEPGGDRAEIRLTSWPSGRTGLLARSSYHGPPVVLGS